MHNLKHKGIHQLHHSFSSPRSLLSPTLNLTLQNEHTLHVPFGPSPCDTSIRVDPSTPPFLPCMISLLFANGAHSTRTRNKSPSLLYLCKLHITCMIHFHPQNQIFNIYPKNPLNPFLENTFCFYFLLFINKTSVLFSIYFMFLSICIGNS